MTEEIYAVHEVDEEDDSVERFLFRLVSKNEVERVAAALYSQNVMQWCQVREELAEHYREGYTNRTMIVTMRDIDYSRVSPPNLRRMITEMFFAQGLTLKFIRWNRFLNLKARY